MRGSISAVKGLAEHLGVWGTSIHQYSGNTGPAVSKWPWLRKAAQGKQALGKLIIGREIHFTTNSLSLELICINGKNYSKSTWKCINAEFCILKEYFYNKIQKGRHFLFAIHGLAGTAFVGSLHSNGSSGAVGANIKRWRQYKERKCLLQTAFRNRKRVFTH